eukprot:815091-Pyramimonas_sp.AAC.1
MTTTEGSHPDMPSATVRLPSRGTRQVVRNTMALPALEAQVHVVQHFAGADPEQVDANARVVHED